MILFKYIFYYVYFILLIFSGCLNVIWELLMMLPVNEKIREGLVKLEKKWEELFDENSLYKSLYCLQIIEELSFSYLIKFL